MLGAQVRFEAETNAKEVFLDGTFEVSFILYNAEGANFTPPDFGDFTVLAGPNRRSSTSIVNGVRTSEQALTYILRPKRAGLHSIGAASVEVKRQKIYTQPLKISVVDGQRKPAEKNPPAFLKAEVNTEEAYPGQQIILDYKIYIQTRFFKQGHQVEEKPDYAGFYAEQLNYYRSYQEIVDGVEYVSMTLARLALFPQRSGALEIPPLTLLLDIGERRSNPFGLGLAPMERLRVNSNTLTIQVSPFPENRPADFSGAVGDYTFTATVNRTELSTDDALSLKVLIRGDGDIKQVGIPQLMGVDSFEVFPPGILSEKMEDNGAGQMRGEKEIEYLLTPKAAGEYEIPLAFSYLDPEGRTFMSSGQGPLRIVVRPGSGRKDISDGPAREEAKEGLLPLWKSARIEKTGSYWIQSPLFWGITALPFLAWLGFALFRRWQTREERMDPALVQERRIRQVVEQRLGAAKAHLQNGDYAALFAEVSQALGAYLRHKLGIPPARWSKDRVSEELAQAGVAPELIDQVRQTLLTCEMALYAGQDKEASARQVIERAADIIRQMEK